MTRRSFFGAAAAAGTLAGNRVAAADAPGAFAEPAQRIPVDDWADVIVAGGGPAGVAAAVSAARAGAKVRLLELQGCLGGIWTAGFLSYIFDFNKSDIGREIIRRLDAYGARAVDRPGDEGMKFYRRGTDQDWVYEPEYMKAVCEDMCAEAGVRVTLQCPVAAAYRDASGRNVETVVTESKSGRQAWRARTFIDCTGDGDLGARAGCGFDVGGDAPGDSEQPASLIALVTIPDDRGILKCIANEASNYDDDGRRVYDSKLVLLEEMKRVGISPSYGHPTMFRVHPHLYAFMCNHEYDVPVDDADAITAATLRARREVYGMVDALVRNGGEAWKGFRLVATAEQLGHRRARRLHGRYTMTVEDCLEGRKFPDGLCTCSFGLDVHAVSKAMNKIRPAGMPINMSRHVQPYQIPLRACHAKDIDNLYMAGRCISGNFLPQASYRITGTSIGLGVGVGKAVLAL